MKIVCISDTHLRHQKYHFPIPDGDILIHAGDATFRGSKREILAFNEWFAALPHKHKIFVAGNHDWSFQKANMLARNCLAPHINYLQDSEITIDGVRIYGSPWQPEFCDWAFNLPRGAALKEKWDKIPAGIDILVTHGPAFGYGDMTERGEPVGCEELAIAIQRVKPKVHIFGHIHNAYGRYDADGVIFINASICDEEYVPSNAPIVLDFPNTPPEPPPAPPAASQ